MPIFDHLKDQPGHAPGADRLCHRTKGFLIGQVSRQAAVLNSVILYIRLKFAMSIVIVIRLHV